jgi:prepilin peptidase CpaA
LKSYKIPNFIILIGYFLSLIFFHQEYEWTSICKWAGNILIPILILFPLFLIKALGAGDIKLFSVIGGFFGLSYAIQLMAISFVIGAILSLLQIIRYKNLKFRLLFFSSYLKELHLKITTQNVKKFEYYDKKRDGTEGVIHFSIAIFLGFIINMVFSLISKI